VSEDFDEKADVGICSDSLIEVFVGAQETELIGEAVLVWYYLEQDYCS